MKPVEKDNADLMFAVNTNWDVFYDATAQRYYLLNTDNWLSTGDVIKGQWTAAGVLQTGLSALPQDENWADVRQQIPGKRDPNPPAVFASAEPAELIITKGEPKFQAIPSTTVQHATNSPKAVIWVDGAYSCCDQGVWFCGAVATGPWTYCTSVPQAIYTIPASIPSDP